MGKLRITIIILVIFLSGCTWFEVKTTIITPKGDIYTIISKPDAMVELSEGDIRVVVDNRGRPGMVEQALGIMFMNLPDVSVEAD